MGKQLVRLHRTYKHGKEATKKAYARTRIPPPSIHYMQSGRGVEYPAPLPDDYDKDNNLSVPEVIDLLAKHVRRQREEQRGAGVDPVAASLELKSTLGTNEMIVASGNPIEIRHPARIIFLGPSGAGKTTLATRLLTQTDRIFEPAPQQIVWYYQVARSIDSVRTALPHVTFIAGMPEAQELLAVNDGYSRLVVIDDIAVSGQNARVKLLALQNLFSGVRHANISIIIMLHDLRGMTSVVNNCTHLIGMLNGAGSPGLFRSLNTLLNHERTKYIKWCADQTRALDDLPYPYLCCEPGSNESILQLRTRILEGDKNTFFAPAGMRKTRTYLDLRDGKTKEDRNSVPPHIHDNGEEAPTTRAESEDRWWQAPDC